jgi:hypothetical protein
MSDPGGTAKPKTLGRAIDEMIAALVDLNSDSERLNAIRTVLSHFNLSELPVSPPSPGGGECIATEGKTVTTRVTDIRALKEEKQPSTANEMAAVVAYYLQELAPPEERKRDVGVQDIVEYFKQAGFRLPKATQQILHNAKAAGYFKAVGAGRFALNPVGYNLVVHNLPRAEKLLGARRHAKKTATRKQTNKRKAE